MHVSISNFVIKFTSNSIVSIDVPHPVPSMKLFHNVFVTTIAYRYTNCGVAAIMCSANGQTTDYYFAYPECQGNTENGTIHNYLYITASEPTNVSLTQRQFKYSKIYQNEILKFLFL